jgi:hypothetical protein
VEITNVQTVPILDWSDLTTDERAMLDWDTEHGGVYFRHRGNAFSLAEFSVTTNPALQDLGYVGVSFDTMFSATVVKMPDYDNDEITVAWVYSGSDNDSES